MLYGQDVLFQTTMRANATIRISKDMVERKDVKSKLSTTHYKDLLAKIDKNVAKKILPRITLVPRTDPKEYTTTMVPYLRARFAHTGPAARHRDPDVTNEQNKIDAARKANKKRQRKD